MIDGVSPPGPAASEAERQSTFILTRFERWALPQLAALQAQMHLIHQTGRRDYDVLRAEYDRIAPFYEVTAFVHNVEDFYNRCDLLICRSGAITLAEITALGKPAVLVPLPTSTQRRRRRRSCSLSWAGPP